MVEGTDLYTILVAYANKNNSPYINITGFLDYLGKAARKFSGDYPAWQKWSKDTATKFRAEISLLVEGGKCELLPEPGDGQVYLSSYFSEKIRAAYAHADDNVELPFPNEHSLGITLPENQVKHLNSDYDLLSVLAEPGDNDTPILKICFPENFGFAILPFDMFPRQISEIALLKIRNYISRYGNKEYIYHQLAAQLQGKEAHLKDQLEQILIKPMDQYRAIGENRETTSLFWTHLCGLIKNEIKKKNEKLTTDIAVFQSVYIIEVINSYFKSTAAKRREVEAAFRNLESQLAKPPYLYTMDQIVKFSGPGGGPLLGQYTSDELSEWMKRQITESKNNELPALLIIKVKTRDEQQYFLLKEKMMPLCARLLHDGKILIRRAIVKQWSKLISDFETDLAMANDGEFEKLLAKTAEKLCPELMSLLSDPKFFLMYQEMDKKDGITAATRIIHEGKLLPYSSVFLIRRKAMLQEAKFALPFWFSLPIISDLIRFFKNLFKKEKKAVKKVAGDEQVIAEEKDHAGEIRMVAEKLEFDIVPPGYTIDGYLEELADRWSRLLDSQARETLINDVEFLTTKQLRRRLKVDKQFEPTREALNQMAYDMVTHNTALSSLSARDSLLLFMELYMIKLLLGAK